MMLKRWWLFPLLAVFGVVAGIGIAAVLTYLKPKTFDSTAMVEIKPDGKVLGPFGTDPPTRNRNFLKSQMLRLKSPNLLLEAVKEGDFKAKWLIDAEKAAEILNRSITVTEVPGTDLLTIRGRHTNREDARDMVLSLIAVYAKQRKSSGATAPQKAMAELGKAVRKQEDRVEERRKELSEQDGQKDLLHREFRPGERLDPTEDYTSNKQQFEADLELLQTLKLKYVTERVTLQMDDDPVVVHEEPQLAMVPSGPNVAKNMVYGMIGGFLVSQVIALLLAMALPGRD